MAQISLLIKYKRYAEHKFIKLLLNIYYFDEILQINK